MNELATFTAVTKDDIKLGETTRFPLYDAWGNQLLDAGIVIDSEQLVQDLLDNAYRSDDSWDEVGEKPASTESTETTEESTHTAPSKPSDELNKDVDIELDSVRWHVGETFYLQVHDNANLRYVVKLIGFAKNKSIIVTAPTIEGRGAHVRDGQSFIVRAFPGKKAYAFVASAIKSVYSPYSYLHLSYPKQVRGTTIRQNSRAVVKIIASVTVGNPEQTGAATLGDLSISGTSGIIKRQLGKKNDIGTIKFKVNAAGNDEYLSLKFILRSVSQTDNPEEFRHGIEFIEVSPQAKLILSAFVHQTLAESESV